MGRNPVSMVTEYFFPIFVGVIFGGLSALGVGGGSLLMLWLTLVLGAEQEYARLMNLMFFIPCALVASIFRWKQAKLDWKLVLTAVAAGCLGSVLGNLWRQGLDLELLRKIFGVLFVICGIRELCYRPKKPR